MSTVFRAFDLPFIPGWLLSWNASLGSDRLKTPEEARYRESRSLRVVDRRNTVGKKCGSAPLWGTAPHCSRCSVLHLESYFHRRLKHTRTCDAVDIANAARFPAVFR